MCALAAASAAEHDYDAYLKIALDVLLSAARRAAAPAHLLATLTEAMSANTEGADLTDLTNQADVLLKGQPVSDGYPPRQTRRISTSPGEHLEPQVRPSDI